MQNYKKIIDEIFLGITRIMTYVLNTHYGVTTRLQRITIGMWLTVSDMTVFILRYDYKSLIVNKDIHSADMC